MEDLLARVRKAIDRPGKKAAQTAAFAAPAATATAVMATPATPPPPTVVSNEELPALLKRDDCMARARNAPQSKALSGVAGQVMQAAASPRSDATLIASIIARDPILSAKILRAANSAAYTSSRGPVISISDAIKQVGCSTVRNIAAALGLVETFSAQGIPGFDPIRSWQHCFAVATLCEMLAKDGEEASIAYLVGLCHELGEMLYYAVFGKEHQQAVEAQARTGKPLAEVQQTMLGMTQYELVGQLFSSLELPDAIRAPIEAVYSAAARPVAGKLARVLQIADAYANGMLLAASGESSLVGLTQGECKAALGEANPDTPKRDELRAKIMVLTAMMSGVNDTRVLSPIYQRTKVKIWLAREAGLSSFDPIEAALESLGECQVQNRLPNAQEAGQIGALVVAARSDGADGLQLKQIAAAAAGGGKAAPVLWMVRKVELPVGGGASGDVKPVAWPVTLASVQQFIAAIK